MRTFILAILSLFFVVALFLSENFAFFQFEYADDVRNIGILIVALLFSFEGIAAIKSTKDSQGIKDEIDDKSKKIKDLEKKTKAAEDKLGGLESEKDRLQSAFEKERSEAVAKGEKLEQLEKAFDDVSKRLEASEKERTAHKADDSNAKIVELLGLLQKKGRFIDFLKDDITQYPDPQVGAAARIVHQGCASVLDEYFDIKPIMDKSEGSHISLGEEYDSKSFRIIGKIKEQAPYEGTLMHHGWLTSRVELPELTESNANTKGVIAPAEVELN